MPAVTAKPWLAPLNWTDLGKPEPARPAQAARPEAEITDLTVLVERDPAAPPGSCASRARTARGSHHCHRACCCTTSCRPPLGQNGRTAAVATLHVRVWDLPARQQQQPAVLDLDTFSHLMAAGAPRSGRSQLLRTIAGTLALAHSSADVHLYGIDCGNGALLPLTELPHCGAVVSRAQTERADAVAQAAGRRAQQTPGAARCGGLCRHPRAAGRGPAGRSGFRTSFVLLDRWEGFTSTLGELEAGSLTDVLTRLLSEGASVGMHLVMTGDRSLLVGRISALCEEKLVFKLAEKEDYRLAGLNPRDLPDDLPPGRAFRCWLRHGVAGGTARTRRIRARADRRAAVHRGAMPVPRCGGAGNPAAVPGGRAAVARVIRRRMATAATSPPDPCGAWSGSAATHSKRSGRTSPPGCPASSWPAPPNRDGPPSCCPWRDRSSRPEHRSCWPHRGHPRSAHSLALPGVLGLFDRPELSEAELAEALSSFTRPGVVLIDDAELLRDCGAASELSRWSPSGAMPGVPWSSAETPRVSAWDSAAGRWRPNGPGAAA